MCMKRLAASLLLCLAVGCSTHSSPHTQPIPEDDSPVCMVEPNSALPEGVEIVFYPHMWMDDNEVGLQISMDNCPNHP